MRSFFVAACASSLAALALACASTSEPAPPAEASGDGGATADGGAPASGSGGAESGGTGASDSGPWPEGKLAAVSLTYDDGLDGQLKHAVPALDARGLLGTFFLSSFQGVPHVWALPDTTTALNPRHMAWQAVAQAGHELGGHTIYHPCDNNNAGYKPEDYDQERMAAELDESIARLKRLSPDEPQSFAYPCYGDTVGIAGGASYMPLVDARFLTARTSAEGVSDPATVPLTQAAQRFGDAEGTSADALIAYVDEALAAGGWAVFTFHGIGPAAECDINQFNLDVCALNYLTTSSEAHAALLDYLVQKQSEVWTAPMKAVAAHIQSTR